MTTRMQKVRLGVFMLLAILLLFGSVATLVGMQMWNPKDRFFVRFTESISGLESGSTVKMKGVRVGQVERITVGKDVESVIVTLSLDPGTPVTVDTRAVMTSIGITGLQFIELTGGTTRSKRIPPNTRASIIQAGSSTLETLTGKATDIALKMEGVLNNLLVLTAETNRVRIARLLEDADKLAVSWEQVASSNSTQIRKILGNVDRTTLMMERASGAFTRLATDNSAKVGETLTATANAAKSLSKMAQTIKPQATLTSISDAADAVRKRVEDPSITKALAALNATANKLTGLTTELGAIVRQRDRQIGTMMVNLDKAALFLKDFARSIKEQPSLLLRGETRKDRSVP